MINFDPIEPNIIIGSCPHNTIDVDRLHRMLRVTAILSLQTEDDFKYHKIDWPAMEQDYDKCGIYVQRFPIADFNEQDLGERVSEPIKALNDLLNAGHKVYVHCNAGVCRASATVVGYLCHYKGMEPQEALAYVRERRPIANPYMRAVEKALEKLKQDV